MRQRIMLALGTFLACIAACESDPDTGFIKEVRSEGGVEVVGLHPLPRPLDPAHRWILEPVRTVSPGPEEALLFYDLRAVLPLGTSRLVVHDPLSDAPLKILDLATESLAASFGRTGQGPGELDDFLILMKGPGAGFSALDIVNRQVHRFTETGEQLESLPFRPGMGVAGGAAMPGTGALLVVYPDNSGAKLASFDVDGNVVSMMGELPVRPPGVELGTLHRGRPMWTAIPSASITMFSAAPIVELHLADGTSRRLELPLTQRRITSGEIEQRMAQYPAFASSLEPGPAALTNFIYPVADSVFGLLLSDLWRAEEDVGLPRDSIYWRLFSTNGEYLGVTGQPDGYRFLGLGDGTLWARTLNDVGQPALAELRLTQAN